MVTKPDLLQAFAVDFLTGGHIWHRRLVYCLALVICFTYQNSRIPVDVVVGLETVGLGTVEKGNSSFLPEQFYSCRIIIGSTLYLHLHTAFA